MLRTSVYALAVALTLTAAVVGQEQRPGQAAGGQSGQVQQADGRGEQYMNNVLGTCLIVGNQKEIALLQYGQGKVQHPQLKQACEKMTQDHKAFIQKLQQQGGVRPVIQVREMSVAQQGSGQEGGVQPTSGQNREGQGGSDAWPVRMLQVQQEVCQQGLMNARKELEQRQGAQFDKAFTGMQVAAHMHMLNELQVYKRHATGELRTVLEQGERTTEQHLSHVKGIMQQLERGGQNQDQ